MAKVEKSFTLNILNADLTKHQTDLLVFAAFEDTVLNKYLKKLDKELNNKISKSIQAKIFSGKEKEVLIYDAPAGYVAEKIVVLGLGKEKEFNLDKNRTAAALAVKTAKQLKYAKVSMFTDFLALVNNDALYALLEGAFLAAYKFQKLERQEKAAEKKSIKNFTILTTSKLNYADLVKKAEIVMNSVNLAKDLVNLPANIVTPGYLEKTAKTILKDKLKINVISFNEAKKLGFGGFCAVAQGTEEPPKIIILEYKGGGPSTGSGRADIFGLVGKGITFDSGGISLKPSSGMGEMKTDMSGAATVLATMLAITELKIKKNIIAIIPATENLPSGKAYKPGDVITMLNGTHVEINSTDAEGRMILADALTYIQKLGASKIIDFATLTGACLIALGQTRTGIMTNDQNFADSWLKIAERTGEKFWQLPMDEEYEELLKSSVADTLNNSESKYAGTISGGKFLEKFIEKGTKWIHCDIAGTAYLSKPQRYLDKQATGVAIRTLVEYFSKV